MMAENQTEPDFENEKSEGAARAVNGRGRQMKDDALTTGTEDFLHGADGMPHESDFEMFDDDFFDDEDDGEDGFYTNEPAFLSEDLEGYLLDEFDWPGSRQRPFRTSKTSHEEDDLVEKHNDSRLVKILAAQAGKAQRASQAAALMGAAVPLLVQKHAAAEAALQPILPALIALVADAARRLHRRPGARQAIAQLPQVVDNTIALLLRYVSARPRLTPGLTARVLDRQLQIMSRRQWRSRPSNRQSKHRLHGRFYNENDDDWLDMDL